MTRKKAIEIAVETAKNVLGFPPNGSRSMFGVSIVEIKGRGILWLLRPRLSQSPLRKTVGLSRGWWTGKVP
jgi:hypothetical protein